MNEYTVRYCTGTNRYSRQFYVGRIKADSFTEATERAEGVAKRKSMEVVSVTRVFAE